MVEESSLKSGSVTRTRGAGVALAVVLLVAAAGYAFHEHGAAQQLANQNNQIASTLAATREQVGALTAKLDALSAKQAEATANQPPIYRKPMTAATQRHRIDDPRWKKVQGQLDDQGKQIEATRQDLASARTDLQGSIAKTHDELVVLQMKGERNYYEFDLDKSGQFQREGSVGVRLRKANTKHEDADLELLVDDFSLSKKHVDVYEPVVFYPADSKLPVELVINRISKNHIHGYVSEPKYKSGEVEAMANSPTGNAAKSLTEQSTSNSKPSAARQTLPLPQTN